MLRVYHRHFDQAIPASTPVSILNVFTNPLHIFQLKSHFDAILAKTSASANLIETLFTNVRTGLASGLHIMFLASMFVMAIMLLLALFMPELPLRKTKDPA